MRKRAWLAATGVTIALVATACSGGGGSKEKSSGGTGTTVSSGGTVDPTGVLRYGYDLENNLTNLDPAISGNTCDQNVWQFIYDSLIHVDKNGKLSPGLAQSWTLEGKTLTLKLRPDVKWQDGTAFDAASVKSGIDHNNKNPNLTALDLIASMDVVDPLTLRLNLKEERGTQLLYGLAGQDGMLVAPSAQANASKAPVGAGPFKFVSFTPGQRLSLRPYADYWDKANWKLGGIDFEQVGIGPPTVTALRSGAVDLIRFQPESYPVVSKLDNVETSTTASGQYAQFEFRQDRPPFNDVRVRQAVEYAINRAEINKVVEVGKGEVASQPFPKGSPFHVAALDNRYPYSPDKARELLAQAGHPNGFSFDMAIPGGNIANMESQAVLIQAQLKKVGIDAKITRILPQELANVFYLRKQGDAFSAEELQQEFAPDLLYGNFGKLQFVAIWDGAQRDDITNLMNQAYHASSEAELTQLMQDAVKIDVEQALEVPIAFVPQFAAWSTTRVGGTPVAPYNSCRPTDLRNVFIKK